MDEIVMLRGMLEAVKGVCPDCADERFLVPVDEDELEVCCIECGAAFVTWHSWAAPTSNVA